MIKQITVLPFSQAAKPGRSEELDFLKGVLILLVISFHLVYFEQLHPYAKQVVYTFHMPGFLLISGYLMNVSKSVRAFLRTLLWLAVPYIVMESGYIVMCSVLPTGEHIDALTPTVFLDHLLLHPLGPYWYLHILILCGGLYYLAFNVLCRILDTTTGLCIRLLLMGIICYAFFLLRLKGAGETPYFLAGVAIRQSGKDFRTLFWASPFALLFFVLFTCPWWGEADSEWSFAIIYFAISTLLWLHRVIPKTGSRLILFLGRNSLSLYIFSPIFTILCKQFVPYLQFDPSGLVFLLVSLASCIAGSLLIAWLMDITGISPYFFGRRGIRK